MAIDREARAQILLRADQLRDLYRRTAGRSILDCPGLMIDIRTLALRVADDVRSLLAELPEG